MTIGELTAVEAITTHCRDGGAVIVAIGPLTNIAEALLADPTLPERIDQLHWMGGSAVGGNTTEFAEFNAWVDPDAAHITMESGVPISMYGLDLTHQVRMDGKDVDMLRDAATPTSERAADFLEFYWRQSTTNEDGKPMHDPCALLGATHPDLFERASSRIVVEAVAEDTRGKTTVLDPVETHRHTHVTKTKADIVTSLIREAAIAPREIR